MLLSAFLWWNIRLSWIPTAFNTRMQRYTMWMDKSFARKVHTIGLPVYDVAYIIILYIARVRTCNNKLWPEMWCTAELGNHRLKRVFCQSTRPLRYHVFRHIPRIVKNMWDCRNRPLDCRKRPYFYENSFKIENDGALGSKFSNFCHYLVYEVKGLQKIQISNLSSAHQPWPAFFRVIVGHWVVFYDSVRLIFFPIRE